MALNVLVHGQEVGVGDRVRIVQKITEGEKYRLQAFEGLVIAIRGREENKSLTIRRIGEAGIGIERIFPVDSPMITEAKVIKSGTSGIRRSKLYFVRNISKKETDKIYSRVHNKMADKAHTKRKK